MPTEPTELWIKMKSRSMKVLIDTFANMNDTIAAAAPELRPSVRIVEQKKLNDFTHVHLALLGELLQNMPPDDVDPLEFYNKTKKRSMNELLSKFEGPTQTQDKAVEHHFQILKALSQMLDL
tara:strand:+ start:58 stop:423 length:366 start_codon:yes stop_codon:yes gene_type:complete